MPKSRFHRGQHVRYPLPHDKTCSVLAIVRQPHHDGSVTVEATFFERNGRREKVYLGFCYRVDAAKLLAA